MSEETGDVQKENDTSEPSDDFNATKAAVKLAYKNKVNIGLIRGTGKNGRVLKGDVRDWIDAVESKIKEKNWNGHKKYVYKNNGRKHEYLDKEKIISIIETDLYEEVNNEDTDES